MKILHIDDPRPGPCDYDVKYPIFEKEPHWTCRAKVGIPLFYDKQDGCNIFGFYYVYDDGMLIITLLFPLIELRPAPDVYLPKPEESNVATSLKGRYKESKGKGDMMVLIA
jgi:hypothetical protein